MLWCVHGSTLCRELDEWRSTRDNPPQQKRCPLCFDVNIIVAFFRDFCKNMILWCDFNAVTNELASGHRICFTATVYVIEWCFADRPGCSIMLSTSVVYRVHNLIHFTSSQLKDLSQAYYISTLTHYACLLFTHKCVFVWM